MRCRRCCSASIPGWPHGSGSGCSFSAWWVYVRSRRQHQGDSRLSTNCGDVHGHAANVPKDRQEKREKRETKFYSCLRVRYVHGHAANVPKDPQEKREKRETKFYSYLSVRDVQNHAATLPKDKQ